MQKFKRHLAKTITWRVIGTIDTFLISSYFSGDIGLGLKISSIELITKMILYFLHERLWFYSKVEKPANRHLFKTFTWRFIGTADTILLAWLFTGNPLTGLKIGTTEVFTKMILYYFHEKIWYRFNFGLRNR